MATPIPLVAKRRTPRPGAGNVRAPKKHNAPLADTLDRLSNAIIEIQQHNASKLSFEEHYRYGYNLVLHKQGHNLYNQVAELVTKHLRNETKRLVVPVFPPLAASNVASGSNSTSEDIAAAEASQLFLDHLRDVWDDHMACMSKLRDVLRHLDKQYQGSSVVPSVWDLGLALFLHHVLLYSTETTSTEAKRPPSSKAQDPSTVAFNLIATLLNVIRIERSGQAVSRHSIQSAVEILSELTDETLVPLPLTASGGAGSASPTFGTGGAAKKKHVMGVGTPGEQESPYRTSFEQAFLKQSKEFYESESARLLIDCDAPTYLKRIEKRLDEEANRSQTYLAPSTEPLLISLLESTLISSHLQAILDHTASGLPVLISESRIDDLRRLYTLFHRVSDGPAALNAGLSAWIVATGKQINEGLVLAQDREVEEEQNDQKVKGKGKAEGIGTVGAKTRAALDWVENVLELKTKFDALLANAFSADKTTEKMINDAFTTFVNQNGRSAEYISLFIDENLKKGLKGKSESEVEQILNRSIELFRFLTEKDQFEKYYNNHLAKRLISNRSVSDDAERNMLAKFKIEAGAAFTKSSEGMMKDMKTSEDALPEYRRWLERSTTGARPSFDMSTIVCSRNNWPFAHIAQPANLPRVLQNGADAFIRFYNTKHSGRKLTFRPDMGSVDVKTRFTARNHELTVSTHAMIVLALFEGVGPTDTISYADIASTTNMPTAELKRTLQSLACAKYKVLTKSPKGRDVDDTDLFAFNAGFQCNLAKIKVQTVASKVETAEERKDTENRVDEERKLLTDACIVRVMKDRKTLAHTELVNEVTRQLSKRFTPRVTMIKHAIETLIERDYLERDAGDRKKLVYLA